MVENPYATPDSPAVTPQRKAIWTKELKSARTILILIGVLQLLGGIYAVSTAKSDAETAIRNSIASKGATYRFDQEKFEEFFEEQKMMIYGIASVPVITGACFCVMAILIFRFPIGATLSALLLYLALQGYGLWLNDGEISKAYILKIFFLIALVKAFQSARAARAAIPA